MQAVGFFNVISLLFLASLINLVKAVAVEDLVSQVYAVNDSIGYTSDFKESSFDQVEGIKQLEEDFFPHEDLVRLAPLTSPRTNSTNSGVWRPQIGCLLVAVSFSTILLKSRFGI